MSSVFSFAVSGPVAVFQSLSFHDDIESLTLLKQAVGKLKILKEAWSMHTVRYNWQRPSLLDFNFNNWSKEKSEGLERLRTIGLGAKTEETVESKSTKAFASNAEVPSNYKGKPNFPPCLLCKENNALWSCAAFKEKNATQRAKVLG